jgi:DNA ligase (NAD+)
MVIGKKVCYVLARTKAGHDRLIAVKISPRKVRLVAEGVKTRKLKEALALLLSLDKRAATPVKKTLESAIANAVNTFKVDKNEKVCKNLKEVEDFISYLSKVRDGLDYGTDGVVVSLNNQTFYEKVGIVGKAPRYMVAYKYPAEKATTIVRDIIVNVGRTGVLTPVALFEPTLVAGSTVSKATLHNLDQIQEKDIRIGDTVIIQKAGDVIPEVVESLPKMRTGKEKKFKMPESCPECEGGVERVSVSTGSGAAYACTNPKCPAKNRRGMQHFVNIFEIYTIGPKILDRFQDEGLISDAADLFTLKKEDIDTLERFGDKSADNIIKSIQDHKQIPLARLSMHLVFCMLASRPQRISLLISAA